MPAEVRYQFWRKLIGDSSAAPSGKTLSTQLWPRIGSIEPDFLVKIETGEGPANDYI